MPVFEVYDDVEGNYKGNGQWWRGVITARHYDNTYDVEYCDGDKECNMDDDNIRRVVSAP